MKGSGLRRKGFTLIELLVVIAIIAILAAILFPIFAQVKDKGRQATCLNNMKQLGAAFNMYTQAWDDKFPASTQYISWAEAIMPYVKNKAVYRCPSDQKKNEVVTYLANAFLTGDPYFTQNYNGGRGITDGLKLSAIRIPTKTVACCDNGDSWYPVTSFKPAGGKMYGGPGAITYFAYGPEPKNWAVHAPGIHLGGINIALADGHARWYKTDSYVGSSGYLYLPPKKKNGNLRYDPSL